MKIHANAPLGPKGRATSTVSAVLKRIGLGKLSRLDAEEPIRRYERRRAGELIHIDVKKLGRIGPHGAGHRVLGRSWAKRAVPRNPASTAAKLWQWPARSVPIPSS